MHYVITEQDVNYKFSYFVSLKPATQGYIVGMYIFQS